MKDDPSIALAAASGGFRFGDPGAGGIAGKARHETACIGQWNLLRRGRQRLRARRCLSKLDLRLHPELELWLGHGDGHARAGVLHIRRL